MKKPLAIFTIIKDEPEFIGVWVDHYSKAAPKADLFILDNESEFQDALCDAASSGSTATVVPIRHDEVSHGWMRETVERFFRFLLQSYEAVLFAEVDEFIFTRNGDSLDEYAGWMPREFVRCQGYEVVQQEGEPPVREVAGCMLRDRSMWYPTTQYSKPLMGRLPMTWVNGFHMLAGWGDGADFHPDPNLLLVHLHKVDYGIAEARHERFARRKWNQNDLDYGMGFQNRMVGEELKAWFRTNVDHVGQPQPLEAIPDDIKTML